jgi:cytochrome oxidase Cu insertion factor (SCO1/SenC/PrrC family)
LAQRESRSRRTLPVAIWLLPIMLVLIAAGSVYWAHAQTTSTPVTYHWFNGFAWQPERTLPMARNFSLPDQNRSTVSLRQFRGKVAIVSFTSSVCHQQCPLVGRSLAMVERNLGPLAAKSVLVNVSVDPEADTRATVNEFARKMGWAPYHWYYLWAPRPVMKPIWKAYYVYVPTPAPIFKPGVSVIHTAAVVLVDQTGHVRGYMAWPFLPSKVTLGVRDLIDGKV